MNEFLSSMCLFLCYFLLHFMEHFVSLLSFITKFKITMSLLHFFWHFFWWWKKCSWENHSFVLQFNTKFMWNINTVDILLCRSFDVILDPFGGQVGEKFTSLLSKWKGAVFVTLAPPVLSKTDDLGAGLGLLSAGQSFTSSALQKVRVVQHSKAT